MLAGQGGAATFLEQGRVRVVPPHRTFQTLVPIEAEHLQVLVAILHRGAACHSQFSAPLLRPIL